jgi:hypothetical protein
MRFDTETRHRSILPLLAVALVASYLFGFLPLARKAESLDAPLQKKWRQLAATLGPTNALKLDFVSVTNQIAETRAALVTFEAARLEAQARVKLDPELRALINESFQLVDYENEASRQRGVLTQLAKQQNVVLEPAVLAGFPEQTADMKEPSLLWVELAFLDSLLTTAVNAKVTTIHSVAAPLPLTNAPPTNGSRPLTELPVQIELTGPIQNVATFLQTLPLRADEIKAAGLPAAPTNKPALFFDRLVLRKQSPDKPDEVRVSLRAVGFVLRE